MLIAQSLGEYGAMAGLAASLQSLFSRVGETIDGFGTKEYTVIAVVGVAAVVFLLRRN